MPYIKNFLELRKHVLWLIGATSFQLVSLVVLNNFDPVDDLEIGRCKLYYCNKVSPGLGCVLKSMGGGRGMPYLRSYLVCRPGLRAQVTPTTILGNK